ncbi:MAG: hypothetical protein ACYC6F_17310 [Longimicrobiales bacterium]
MASRRAFWLALGERVEGKNIVRWIDPQWGSQSISYAAVKLYHDDREPSAPYLIRVAHVFGIHLQWLATGVGPMDRTGAHIADEFEAAEREAEAARDREADDALDRAFDEFDEFGRRMVEEVDRREREDAGIDDALLNGKAARACFAVAWQRLADSCPDHDLTPEQLNKMGHQLLNLLRSPLDSWGFDREGTRGDPRRQEDYVLAMLHALMVAMQGPGDGEPIVGLEQKGDRSARRRERTVQEETDAEEA